MSSAAVKWSFMWFVPWMSSVFIVPAGTWAVWQSTQRLVRGTQTYLCSVWSEKKTDYLLGFSSALCGIHYVCKCCWTPAILSGKVTHSPRPKTPPRALCLHWGEKTGYAYKLLSYGTAAYLGGNNSILGHFFLAESNGRRTCLCNTVLTLLFF